MENSTITNQSNTLTRVPLRAYPLSTSPQIITSPKRQKAKVSRRSALKKTNDERKRKQITSNQYLKVGTRGVTGNQLTLQQNKFLKFLLDDPKLCASKAAEKAGYNNPAPTAVILLRNPRIKDEIERCLKLTSRHLDITAEKTLSEIANIAYSNVIDYCTFNDDGTFRIDISSITRNQAAAIQEIITEEEVLREPIEVSGVKQYTKIRRTRIKLWDKLSGLQQLCKFQKLMPQDEPTQVTINILDAIIHNSPQLRSGHPESIDDGEYQNVNPVLTNGNGHRDIVISGESL